MLTRQRMAMPRLRVAPDQYIVSRLEEEDAGIDATAFQGAAHGGEGERGVAGTDVEDDRDLLETLPVPRNQLG